MVPFQGVMLVFLGYISGSLVISGEMGIARGVQKSHICRPPDAEEEQKLTLALVETKKESVIGC